MKEIAYLVILEGIKLIDVRLNKVVSKRKKRKFNDNCSSPRQLEASQL